MQGGPRPDLSKSSAQPLAPHAFRMNSGQLRIHRGLRPTARRRQPDRQEPGCRNGAAISQGRHGV